MKEWSEVSLELCYPSPRAREVDKKAVGELAKSIEETGLLQPITVRRVQKSRAGQMSDAFEVIAGMHRVKAFRKLGRAAIPAFITEMDDLRAELALIDENLCRNDLSPAERAAAQARRKALYQQLHPETKAGGDRKSNGQVGQMIETPRYDEAAAEATGQSERAVRRDVTRGEALGDDVLAKVARTSLDKGEELDALAKLNPERRAELVDKAAAGEKVSAKHEVKKQQRESRERVLAVVQRALPQKKYGVILADPEWRFEVYSRETGMDRAADNHYPTTETDDICKRDVGSIAADDCVLFLWATVPMLPDALKVMAAWGFAYKSHRMWRKAKIGTGYWFRNAHELMLVGTRGNIPAPAMGTQWDSVGEGDNSEHSRKPDWQYELIEHYFPNLPKIELNARRARPGWDAWGLEAPVCTAVDARPDVNSTTYTNPEAAPVDAAHLDDASGEPASLTPCEEDASSSFCEHHGGPPGAVVEPAPAGHETVKGAGSLSSLHDLDLPEFLRRKKTEGQEGRV